MTDIAAAADAPVRLTWRPSALAWVRFMVALLLVSAALLKAQSMLNGLGAAGAASTASAWAQVVGESVLGVWLVSGDWTRRKCALGLCAFTVYAGVTFAKAWRGEGSCGCFGDVVVNPWHTLWLDIAVVLSLISVWPGERCGYARYWRLGFRVAAIAALGTMGAFRWASPPVLLSEAAGHVKVGSTLIADADRWIGRTLPLLGYVAQTQPLQTGQWIVVVHSHRCNDCAKTVPEYEQLARDLAGVPAAPRVVFLEVPPLASSAVATGSEDCPAVRMPLAQQFRWAVRTPLVLAISNGRVDAILQWGRDKPEVERR